jgi:outer membrane lipoprotein-sorting protein
MFQRRTVFSVRVPISLTLLFVVGLALACQRNGQPSSESKAAKSSALSGGAEFEGVITMKMDSQAQKDFNMTYFMKGQHARIETKAPDIPAGDSVMLWDVQGGKMTMLIPSRKMYMSMDLKAAGETLKDVAAERSKPEGEVQDIAFPKLTETGKQETIAGYNCEHWLIGEKQNVDMCIAKGLGYFGMGSQAGAGLGALRDFVFSPKLLASAATHPEWVKFLEGGAFPLKITVLEEGERRMTMEATLIERKPLDDSMFAVPPDYKELSVPGMSKGKR